MRSSTSIALIVLSSVVAPSLAAPAFSSQPLYARAQSSSQVTTTGTGDESGAFWPLLISAIPAAISLFKGKREFEDLAAREPMIYTTNCMIYGKGCPPSGPGSWHRFMIAREDQELLARAAADPESGAFLPLLLSAIPAAISLFKGKRELEDLMAREPFWCNPNTGVGCSSRTHGPFGNYIVYREDANNQESAAFLPFLLSAIPAAISLFKGKRSELDEILARSLVDLD